MQRNTQSWGKDNNIFIKYKSKRNSNIFVDEKKIKKIFK